MSEWKIQYPIPRLHRRTFAEGKRERIKDRMGKTKEVEELERALERASVGLSPVERALMVAKVFREVYGDEWTIEAKVDGGFSIMRGGDHRKA